MDKAVVIVELKDDETRKAAARMALLMYVGEPCRICGDAFTEATVERAVYAGYGQKGRCAHQECWDAAKPKSQWFDPIDQT